MHVLHLDLICVVDGEARISSYKLQLWNYHAVIFVFEHGVREIFTFA